MIVPPENGNNVYLASDEELLETKCCGWQSSTMQMATGTSLSLTCKEVVQDMFLGCPSSTGQSWLFQPQGSGDWPPPTW